jgi:hypothetical protein
MTETPIIIGRSRRKVYSDLFSIRFCDMGAFRNEDGNSRETCCF